MNAPRPDSFPASEQVVALDGPSGTGKSTVARELARRLGYGYLDTGAMYRAATLAALRADVATSDSLAVARIVAASRIGVATGVDDRRTTLDDCDVSVEIRGPEVTAAVSAVSAVPAVRELLVATQRRLIGVGAIVVEGRDIASVVWPSADPKIYLTASEQIRAARRSKQLGDGATSVVAVAADLARRDRLDSSRRTSPLRRTEDAVEVDTSELTIDEVVNILVDICLKRRMAVATSLAR